MDPQWILQDFCCADALPVVALRAANENRGSLVPLLIRELECWLDANEPERLQPNAVFFAFHLLGAWREKSAYPLLARFLQSPSGQIETILGDSETETSHRVMAAVFDGDPQPIYTIILNPNASEYVRSRMLETLAILGLSGRIPRDALTDFLKKCWDDLQPRQDCFAWNGWQSAVAMLGLSELKSIVLRAFLCGAIDRFWVTADEFRRDLAYANRYRGILPPHRRSEYALFGDTMKEMEQIWANRPIRAAIARIDALRPRIDKRQIRRSVRQSIGA